MSQILLLLPAPFSRFLCSLLPDYIFLAPCSLPYFRPCSLLPWVSGAILPIPWLPLPGVLYWSIQGPVSNIWNKVIIPYFCGIEPSFGSYSFLPGGGHLFMGDQNFLGQREHHLPTDNRWPPSCMVKNEQAFLGVLAIANLTVITIHCHTTNLSELWSNSAILRPNLILAIYTLFSGRYK